MSATGSKLWGGRFDRPPDEVFYEFQRSFPFDQRLLPYELRVNRAWTRAIEKTGLLASAEAASILDALDRIEARAGQDPSWLATSDAEDVHHFVESALVELIGSTGWKLHTGRSRNDLVATDFRLFVRDAVRATRLATIQLIAALADRAERHAGVAMPGMTHLQHAQPILLAHFLLAHVEGFFRDIDRLEAAGRSAAECPLGAAALAGAAFPVDRSALAQELGFERPTANSLDSVSARDFALDYLYALSVLATHLSRLAEDMVLFASSEFRFITPGDEHSTGSSIMPQKKNPDAWELIRGKTARSTSALFGLLTTLKGLPTSYQRDLQEDKEPLFLAHDQTLRAVQVAAGAITTMQVNEARLREAAGDPALLATEAADFLVRRGMPFRQAHEVVGKIVREAEKQGRTWTSLPIESLRTFSPLFDESLTRALSVDSALAARDVEGGTAPERAREAVKRCRERLTGLEARP
ncbi:MAG TPA: argininosuccinate lyase [Terriglobia bacterium]|nr:argininosuccinate lyase [Terriglobia bacterium]